MMELWHQPWARLGMERSDYCFLRPAVSDAARGRAGPIWLCTAAQNGPLVDGKAGSGRLTHVLEDGRSVYAMPIPLRASSGMTVGVDAGVARLMFDSIPDRPPENLEPKTERQHDALALLDRVKCVWARLREVESAIADPATIWERLSELWLADNPAANPEMDIIVEQARRLMPTLDLLDRAPRRVLRRTLRMIPLSRVQEIDRRAMTWLVRQPGETMAERAGSNQRIRAIAREENFNTLENRVLRSYAQLAAAIARDYVLKHPGAAASRRVLLVGKLGRRCLQLGSDLADRGVDEATPDATPNFVLQNNPNYRIVWDAWMRLLQRKRILDQLWHWQARSWEEFCALAIVVALQSIRGARLIATSPLIFREEQEQGCWLRHANPLAVFFLPELDVTVEVMYGPPAGRILHMFGAPIWLRFGRVRNNAFLLRWAVWPIWQAKGGLEREDLHSIPPLLPSGAREFVRGGMTIRPVVAGGSAQSECSDKAASVTVGASGDALRDGIALLRDVLVHRILHKTT